MGEGRKKVSLSTEKKMLCLYLLRLLPKVERVRLNPNDMSALEFGKLFSKIPNFQFPATISEMPPINIELISCSGAQKFGAEKNRLNLIAIIRAKETADSSFIQSAYIL